MKESDSRADTARETVPPRSSGRNSAGDLRSAETTRAAETPAASNHTGSVPASAGTGVSAPQGNSSEAGETAGDVRVGSRGDLSGDSAATPTGRSTKRSPGPEVPPAIARGIAEADSLLNSAVAEEFIPGAVLLVEAGGRVLHHRAYGYALAYDYRHERRDSPEPMTVDHIFDVASLTKVFATTLGIMVLVDRHDIDLDAPVRTYLPEFTDASKDSVTVRRLLTHTAGLFPWKPVYFHGRTADDAYRYVTELPLAYPVGLRRVYSDLGFMLLGWIIERRTGQSLDAFLATQLYGPIGLANTSFIPRKAGLGPFAATSHGNPFENRMVSDPKFGYLVEEDLRAFDDWREYVLAGEVNDGNAYYAFGGVAGHAGLFSTAEDLRVLATVVLSGGSYGGRSYVSPEVTRMFLTPDEHGNGLGWVMSNEELKIPDLPPGSFGHTGFTGTYVLVVPKYEMILVLLSNRQNLDVDARGTYHNLNPLRREVAGAVLSALAKG